jgi:hypothetical protein
VAAGANSGWEGGQPSAAVPNELMRELLAGIGVGWNAVQRVFSRAEGALLQDDSVGVRKKVKSLDFSTAMRPATKKLHFQGTPK